MLNITSLKKRYKRINQIKIYCMKKINKNELKLKNSFGIKEDFILTDYINTNK